MQTIKVHDKAVVLVLSKRDAKTLLIRLKQNTGIIKPNAVAAIEEKLQSEIDYLEGK